MRCDDAGMIAKIIERRALSNVDLIECEPLCSMHLADGSGAFLD